MHDGFWDTVEHFLISLGIPTNAPSAPGMQTITREVTVTAAPASLPATSNDSHLRSVVTTQQEALEDMQRRITRLHRAAEDADEERASIIKSLQSQIDAGLERERVLESQRRELEERAARHVREYRELQHVISDHTCTPGGSAMQSSRAVTIIPDHMDPNITVHVDGSASHDTCDAQIQSLNKTVASMQDQIREWSERHALAVAEYETTIADLASKNVKQFLEADSSRDRESRMGSRADRERMAAEESRHVKMLADMAAEQQRARDAAFEVVAVKDREVLELRRQLHDALEARPDDSARHAEMAQLAGELSETREERERLEAELEQFKMKFTAVEDAIQARLGDYERRLHDQQAASTRALADQKEYYERRLAIMSSS